MFIGPDAGIGAEIADHHLDGVEWSVFERRDARVRSMQSIALKSVVGARSLAEGRILPGRRRCIELRNRCLQTPGIDSSLSRKLRQRRAALEVAGAEVAADRHRNGGTHPRPYLRRVLWSQTRKAAISSPDFAAFIIA